MNHKHRSAFFLFSLLLASCASLPPYCEQGKERDAGFKLAMSGAAFTEDDLKKCSSLASENFKTGYAEGKRKLCSQKTAESTAFDQGQTGAEYSFDDAKFKICENLSDLKAGSEKQYGKGQELFCSDQKAEQTGKDRAFEGKTKSFPSDIYRVCGADRQGRLQAAYETGYTTAIAQHCTKVGVEKFAKQRAQKSASVEFPEELQICLKDFPDAKNLYPGLFKTERTRYVESHCSYQEGLVLGRTDAEQGNDKRAGMPQFCDAESFREFQEGFLQGWKEAKDKICDFNKAYQRGLEDGQAKKDMNYQIPDKCPLEYKSSLLKKYRDGFLYGKNQPKIIR